MDWDKYINEPYNKEIKANAEILDKIDFLPCFEFCDTLDDIISYIDYTYDNTEYSNNKICKGYILNWLDDYEFKTYLEHRYPNIEFQEVTTYALQYK